MDCKEEVMADELKPRMQRVEADYLKKMLDNYLTDAEWKILSDSVCQRAYDREIDRAGRALSRLINSGPNL